MSFHTDGTEVRLPSGTVWPGQIDPTLSKLFDVDSNGKRIRMSDYSEADQTLVSLPQTGEARDPRGLTRRHISKLGDSHLFEANPVLTKHLYNPRGEESIPNTKLLSVRDWR